MHRSSALECSVSKKPVYTVEWPAHIKTSEEWISEKPKDQWKKSFEENGFLVLEGVLNEEETKIYSDLYNKILSGEIDTSRHRHDLGNHAPKKTDAKENICQVMWPTLYIEGLSMGPAHLRCQEVSKLLLGDDMVHDFDFLISKAPHTDTITPWHCDESYWLDMSDKRAISFWVAMDTTTLDNGCMWFAAGTHKQDIRPHKPAAPGVHVLTCQGSEDEGTPAPLQPGWATCHSGRTMHYSRGNTTDTPRRGFVISFRPEAMVRYERDNNFDHGLTGVHEVIGNNQTMAQLVKEQENQK